MSTNRKPPSILEPNPLGAYLKARRTKLDPAALGLPLERRRTPGLRREEVAQRAHVSVTWYTWLEQGRGGAPSPDALERIAVALQLEGVEREHLFLLALGHLPEARFQPAGDVAPRLQRVLDALECSPAMIKTTTWDVVAWNRAAAAVLSDYGRLAPDQRNVLRMLFRDPRVRAAQHDWESVARSAVAVFRADMMRTGAGASENVRALIAELERHSPEFAAMWRDSDVGHFGGGRKLFTHPQAGEIALEYSSFSVDGRPDLGMVVYNPATPADAARVLELIRARESR
ncbi:MAG: transcriptional regulator [Rhodanobacter sp. 68-29]|nr:helix-turn-helix domain-containing protein [Rhodanobacter sp.]ODU73787.1 MAG: transcriptional regulator [Rhodanobacter sp. SCN 69-32]OJY59523.1 MAG: transcriptional regulator [Rhodanobacter sp. 68-29]